MHWIFVVSYFHCPKVGVSRDTALCLFKNIIRHKCAREPIAHIYQSYLIKEVSTLSFLQMLSRQEEGK